MGPAERESADSGLFLGSDRSTRRDNVGDVVVVQERVRELQRERKGHSKPFIWIKESEQP